MNYIKITKNDIANGPGVRVVLWVSGCDVHCKGCHNPESWDFNAGKTFEYSALQELIESLSKPQIQGLTLSGGHPLAPQNIYSICKIIYEIRQQCSEKDIWLYTGYNLTYDDFANISDSSSVQMYQKMKNYVLQNCDVVVDGEYVEELRDISLKFRGSSNQRLIDVKQTISTGEIVTL